MIQRWLGTDVVNSVLKTDLFDEAVGEGLVPLLSESASEVIGIDISAAVVETAQRHYSRLIAHCCDVRQIALADQSVDLVVSPSSRVVGLLVDCVAVRGFHAVSVGRWSSGRTPSARSRSLSTGGGWRRALSRRRAAERSIV